MNFTVASSALSKAAALAKKHASMVRLDGGSELALVCRNGPLTLRQTVAIPAVGESAHVSTDDLARVAKTLTGTLTVRPHNDRTRLAFTAGKRRAEAGLIDGIDVLPAELPEAVGVARVLDAATFRTLLTRVRAGSSNDVARPHLCGVLLEYGDERLLSVATQGHWLIAFGDASVEYPTKLLLPGALVAVLLDMLPTEGTVALSVSASAILVVGDGWAVAHAMLDATFPAWRQNIPAGRSLTLHVERDAFIAEVAAVLGIVESLVVFTIDGGRSRCAALTPNARERPCSKRRCSRATARRASGSTVRTYSRRCARCPTVTWRSR